jgi:hypothetical protein
LSSLEVKDLARQVFDLFKRHTDGANTNMDELVLGNVRNFHFQNKVSRETLAETFQYLQLRNLIMHSSNSTSIEAYQLTTFGKSVETDDLFEKIVNRAFVSQLSEIIDQELTRGCFDKSYEDAITSAFRILEERIRARISAGPSLFGLDLVTEAFHPEKGKLVFGETPAERDALYQTYRSAFMMLRNPPSHRYMKDFAGAEIVEIVMFVDLLLKILVKAKERT